MVGFNFPVPVLADPRIKRTREGGLRCGEARESTPDFRLTLRGGTLAAGNSILRACACAGGWQSGRSGWLLVAGSNPAARKILPSPTLRAGGPSLAFWAGRADSEILRTRASKLTGAAYTIDGSGVGLGPSLIS
jgi:hypothetical protein